MTDEFHFGQYTRAEVDEEVQRAVEAERDRSAAALMIVMLSAYTLGLICGALAL